MRTCLSFGLLIFGNRDFFSDWGAEQVIRPETQNDAKGKLAEIKRLHDLPVFWQNRACNCAEEAASSAGTRQCVAKNRRTGYSHMAASSDAAAPPPLAVTYCPVGTLTGIVETGLVGWGGRWGIGAGRCG